MSLIEVDELAVGAWPLKNEAELLV